MVERTPDRCQDSRVTWTSPGHRAWFPPKINNVCTCVVLMLKREGSEPSYWEWTALFTDITLLQLAELKGPTHHADSNQQPAASTDLFPTSSESPQSFRRPTVGPVCSCLNTCTCWWSHSSPEWCCGVEAHFRCPLIDSGVTQRKSSVFDCRLAAVLSSWFDLNALVSKLLNGLSEDFFCLQKYYCSSLTDEIHRSWVEKSRRSDSTGRAGAVGRGRGQHMGERGERPGCWSWSLRWKDARSRKVSFNQATKEPR